MVTILPPKVSLGQQLGMAAGQGLQQGLSQGLQTQYNRGLLQEALSKVRESAQGEDANALDTTLNFLVATAGVPGAERYVGQVLPILLNQMTLKKRADLDSAKPSGPTQPAMPGQPLQQPGIQSAPSEPTQPAMPGQPLQQPGIQSALDPTEMPIYDRPRPTTGFFQSPLTTEEMKARAEAMAATVPGDPTAYERFFKEEQVKKASQEAQQAELDKLALDLFAQETPKGQPVDTTQLPLFRKLAQTYGRLNDTDQIFERTKRDLYRIRNDLDSIGNIVMPYGKALTAKGIGQGIGPRDFTRENVIKEIQPFIKRLVDLGLEDEVRNKLTLLGLSPTEVNLTLHPLRTELDLKARSYKGESQQDLENFIKNNIQSGDSLLGLREKLRNKVDWKQFKNAFHNISSDADFNKKLTPWQHSEKLELLNPPRDSLASLFNGFITDYFGGKK